MRKLSAVLARGADLVAGVAGGLLLYDGGGDEVEVLVPAAGAQHHVTGARVSGHNLPHLLQTGPGRH